MFRKLLCALLLIASPAAFAQVERYLEGGAYFTLKSPQATETGDKIEVLEIFSYACPHCGHLDPVLVKWESTKPEQAQLRYFPAVWQKPGWVEYAAAFFTAQKLGVLKQSHHALMDLLWVQNKAPKDLNEVAAFYTQYGVSADDFIKTMNSPEINTQLRAAAEKVSGYEIEGTPTIIVDGRWRFDVTSAGGPDQVGPLINFLVEKALAQRTAAP